MSQENADSIEEQIKTNSDSRRASQEKYDRIIVSFAGSALGLSIVFTNLFILGGHNVLWPCFLISAWIFWGISILSVIASHFFSEQAYRQKNKKLRARLKQHSVNGKSEGDQSNDRAAKWTSQLNIVSGIFVTAGMISFIIYASYNVAYLTPNSPECRSERGLEFIWKLPTTTK